MTISQEEKIECRHASLQIAINDWMQKEFPLAHRKLDRRMFKGGVMMPSGDFITADTVSLYMASTALEVLKLAFSNAGLNAE